MTCVHKPFDPSSPEDRRYVADEAIAAQKLAGLEVDPDTLLDFEKFCAGQIDLLQLRANVEGRWVLSNKSADGNGC
jgi:hypothetical protein